MPHIFKEMKVLVRLFGALVLLLMLFSCSGYEKVLKSDDYQLKYRKALEFYQKEDYVRAGAILDQCASVMRGTSQADTVYFYQAMSHYKQRDYILSARYFSIFTRTYGLSPFAEEADYMAAYCQYLLSPRPELDQTVTEQAIQAFQLYKIRYPEGAWAKDAESHISTMREKLVEKSFISAKLYFTLEDYKASLVALNNSLLEYPESDFREELLFMVFKSSYLLAENSVLSKQKERYQDAVDSYYSFMAEFPESKYMREAKRYFKDTKKFLGDDIDEDINNDQESEIN